MDNITLTLPEALRRAVSAYEVGRFEEAEQLCQQILAAKSDFFDAIHLLAITESSLGKKDKALASCDRALALWPDHAEVLSNRGVILLDLKRFEEALASFDRALAARPDFAQALSNQGNALHQLNRFEEALASLDRALALRPDFAEALSNRGNTLHEMSRFDEALASLDRALLAQPDYPEALFNRGNSLCGLARFDEALASYDRALKLRPDYAEAHYHVALTSLLMGDFDRGWKNYERRWKTEQLRNNKRNFPQPLWLGSNEIAGKTILLHAEQGFGDTIQFCRYLPWVAQRAAQVVLEAPEPLRDLMATFAGSARIATRGEPLPNFDLHCPLLSLPLAFGTRVNTIPAATPYLCVSAPAIKKWNVKLGLRQRPRIGLAWSGRPTHRNDRNRSIELSALLPILNFAAEFVSLQRDVRPDDATILGRSNIMHFGEELNDFSDTAALILNLDLVISVDTSVAHLAGALAKPVWVLLPFIPDWRWLFDRNDSPWYPTARLFRQDSGRSWDDVIEHVHSALYNFVT